MDGDGPFYGGGRQSGDASGWETTRPGFPHGPKRGRNCRIRAEPSRQAVSGCRRRNRGRRVSAASVRSEKPGLIVANPQKTRRDEKRRPENPARLFLCPASRTGASFRCSYLPEVDALAAVCEFALGMLTYPLTWSLPTLLMTSSSGSRVPEM